MSEKRHFTTKLLRAVTATEASSFWGFLVGEGLCASAISKLKLEMQEFSPEESDLLIITGKINLKMLAELKRIREKMLKPNYCIALGSCFAGCGLRTYAIEKNAEREISVDVFVPGCPVNITAFRQAIKLLVGRY